MLVWMFLGGFVAFLFYVLEVFVALSVIFVIAGGLMSLVYFNQNKLLYMPGTYTCYLSHPRPAAVSCFKSCSLQTSFIARN